MMTSISLLSIDFGTSKDFYQDIVNKYLFTIPSFIFYNKIKNYQID